jgi:hypothetical protein
MTSGFSELITTAMAAAGEIPLEEVFGEDAGAPPRDSAAPTGPGVTTTPSTPSSPSEDAGDSPGTPFHGAEDAEPPPSACALASRGTHDAPSGSLVALAALTLLGVGRRRSRP